MVKQVFSGLTLALVLLATACGGGDSDPPQQPAPAISTADSISEADALAKSQAAAAEQGLSLEGLSPKAANIFGEWQVSFEPTGSDSLEGGFLVVLDAVSGDVLDVIEYQ